MIQLDQQWSRMKTIIGQSMGRLTFSHPKNKSIRYGTAIRLRSDLLLTPAHNIFDRNTQAFYEDFQFSYGEGDKQRTFKVSSYSILDQYGSTKSEKQSKLYDYAILQIQSSFQQSSLCSKLFMGEEQYKQKSPSSQILSNKQIYLQIQESLIRLQAQKLRWQEQKQQLSNTIRLLREEKLQLQNDKKDLENKVNLCKEALKHSNISFQAKQQKPPKQANQTFPFEANQSIIVNSYVTNDSILQTINSHNFSTEVTPLKLDLTSPSIRQYYDIEHQKLFCTQVNNNQYRVVSSQPLSAQSKTQFRLVRYSDKNSYFCVGITSERLKHLGSQKIANETVQYWSYNYNKTGKFKMNGEKKLQNSKFYIKQGNIVTVDADLDQMKIKFKNNSTAGEFKLDSSFKGKKMYIFFMIFNKGDEIEIRQ